MNLATHQIAGLYEQKLFQIATAGREGLCEQCQKCPLTKVCGGGYLPHRYSRENGYANPSVYCRDLMKLITHIAQTVTAELQQSLAKSQAV